MPPARLIVTLVGSFAAATLAQSGPPVRFTDITAAAGVRYTHDNGAQGQKYLPETLGSGSAFFDYDADGDQDLLLVSGVLPDAEAGRPGSYARLFRNDGRGNFTDVTAASGFQLDAVRKPAPRPPAKSSSRRVAESPSPPAAQSPSRPAAQSPSPPVAQPPSRPAVQSSSRPSRSSPSSRSSTGMGVAAGDYDNDGWPDVLVTAVGQSRLFRNLGGGRFGDVTAKAGLAGRRAFSTSAMWLDYDRDGSLDLLISNYVQWSRETDIFCSANGKAKTYCTPEAYRGSTSWLYRNKGTGAFEDVTARAGLFDVTSKSLGVALLDYDQDGWPDIFIANDTQPNKLYRNRRNGTFTELGLTSGLAFSTEGRARAGMGVDATDLDNTGRPALAVTNFSGEMVGLYAPLGGGQYADQAPRSDIGRATRQTLGWGVFFFDVDLDGRQDLLVVNGHLDAALARADRQERFAEAPHLFLNVGGGRFEDVARAAGEAFASAKVGRGAAFADIDLDGDLDTVVTENGGRAHLYRNDLQRPHHSLRIRLRGTQSNRDAIGAKVTVTVGEVTTSRLVRTGSSYLSQSELPLTVGLGTSTRATRVVIDWPSGQREDRGPLTTGMVHVLVEGRP